MRKISITISVANTQTIQLTEHEDWEEDGLCVDFFIVNKDIPEKEYLYIVKKQSANLEWLNVEGNSFIFDLELIKKSFDVLFIECDWMKGKVCLSPHYDFDIVNKIPVLSFHMSKGEIEMNTPKKIFLSHKSSNKPMVRNYFNLLKELGYEPWLDEDAMVAGVNPDRGILDGFKESCACVFFITPDFKDERFLADEIDNARHEKRQKGDKFSIITLQFQDEHGKMGVVPELLQRAIWKTPTNELEAFKEIVRALPIKLGSAIWR